MHTQSCACDGWGFFASKTGHAPPNRSLQVFKVTTFCFAAKNLVFRFSITPRLSGCPRQSSTSPFYMHDDQQRRTLKPRALSGACFSPRPSRAPTSIIPAQLLPSSYASISPMVSFGYFAKYPVLSLQ
jgi:hypothetical protein